MFIVLDKDPRFTAHFWKSFQKAMGTQLMMTIAVHPQTDGQSERTIVTSQFAGFKILEFFFFCY